VKDMLQNPNSTVNVEIPEQKGYFYPIIIGENLLQQAGTYIRQYSKANRLLIITNNTVYPLYAETLKSSLLKENYEFDFVILEDGEKFKNTTSLETIWQKAIEYKLERKDAIVALGGGVIGDVTGFAASTYLRGVDFIQIPTTLLAQVDSSVGGKAAVNHKLGKNLIGSFYQPKLVLTDTSTLETLSVEELKVGLAEVLKYGFIEKSCNCKSSLDISLIEYLKQNKDAIFSLDEAVIKELVKYCCELKAAVVNQDEKESGLRAILNFGHTIGHAVEKCMNYENINHGNAVAIGMKGAFYIARTKNLITEDYYQTCIELLKLYDMDYKINSNIDSQALYEAMKSDKKVQSGKIRFVLSNNVSEVAIYNDIDRETVLEATKTLY
jgi:3-dehydroquinate synthase